MIFHIPVSVKNIIWIIEKLWTRPRSWAHNSPYSPTRMPKPRVGIVKIKRKNEKHKTNSCFSFLRYLGFDNSILCGTFSSNDKGLMGLVIGHDGILHVNFS